MNNDSNNIDQMTLILSMPELSYAITCNFLHTFCTVRNAMKFVICDQSVSNRFVTSSYHCLHTNTHSD